MFLFFKRKNNNNYSQNETLNSFDEDELSFVLKRKAEKIGLKSSLVEYAALSRGLNVHRLSRRLILIELENGKQISFHNMNGTSSSRVGKFICDRKQDTRYLLQRRGLSVVESEVFSDSEFNKAVDYVKSIGFPVVVKPTTLARGMGITTKIESFKEFEIAWKKAINAYKKKSKNKMLLVERHFTGEDYRFFVVDNKVVSVTHRKRANVTGDGKSTILELIRKKNAERAKNPYLSNYLIPEEYNLFDVLEKQNFNLDDIPKKGQEVILRSQSNLSAGGDSIDITDDVHPEYKSIAVEAVKCIPGIEYGGVDIISSDIYSKPNKRNHIVGEVEFSPAPLAHFPYIGHKRDMAGAIIEFYMSR